MFGGSLSLLAMLRFLRLATALVLALGVTACDTAGSKSTVPTPAQFTALGQDHNAAMDHGARALAALSDAERADALSTSAGREALALRTVDPFMTSYGYSLVSDVGLTRYGTSARLADEGPVLTGQAQALIDRLFAALESGETSEVLAASVAGVQADARAASLSDEELTVVLSTAAIAEASSEYWLDFLLKGGGVDGEAARLMATPEDCAKSLAIADGGGALIGAFFGGLAGAGAGAARASIIAYYDMLHTNRCNN